MLSITIIILLITAAFSFYAFNDASFKQRFIFYPTRIASQNTWYEFLSHGFLHADMVHLAINGYVLYIFGEYIESMFRMLFGSTIGTILFVVLYLSAIVASSYPSFVKHKENPGYRALGASGATSAIVFTFILFNPWQWFLFPPMPAIIFGPCYLWYSSYMEKQNKDNIGHGAHFWGAVYGLVFTLVMIASNRPDYLQNIWYGIISFGK